MKKSIFALFFISIVSFSTTSFSKENYIDQGFIQEDIVWLALNIYFESRCQSLEDKLALAYVVLNRVYSKRYPNTIKDVITQYKQFSWYWDGKSDTPKDKKAWKTSWITAELAINTYVPGRINGATHYHALYVSPYWKDDMQIVAIKGSHILYR